MTPAKGVAPLSGTGKSSSRLAPQPVGSGRDGWDDAPVRHRSDLQGLRAVAVLLVVLDHGGVPFLQGGYVGVDVFFVLSGFLITGLLLRQFRGDGRIRLTEFYVRPARWVLPGGLPDIRAHRPAA